MTKPIQTFNDGVLFVYSVTDVSDPGEAPEQGLVIKWSAVRYHERTVGERRFWNALSRDTRISLMLRVPENRSIRDGDIVLLGDQPDQYEIRQLQYIEGAAPPVMDLSLERVAKAYETGA